MTKLYSLYDTVAEQYGPLFQLKNDALALRSVEVFYEQSEEKDKHFSRSDFALYCLGEMDTEKGTIIPNIVRVSAWSTDGENE